MTFQQGAGGYSGVTDTRLQSNVASTNYGSAAYLYVKANNVHVSLLRFDLSSLPAGAQIESASLSLYLDRRSTSKNMTLAVYPLARSWVESEATWDRPAAGQNWAQAGAASDYLSWPASHGTVGAPNSWYELDVSDTVRQWTASPASNFGFLLRGDESSNTRYTFISSDNSSTSLRPRLVVTFSGAATTTPAPPTATPTIPPATATPTVPPATATPTAPAPTPTVQAGTPDWNSVSSWVYQLSGYQNNRLDQIANSHFNLAVVDLARDGSSDFFTQNEIAAVQSTGKVVLAYFEIGAIENYRPEWPLVSSSLMLGPVSGWPGEQYVKYWDEQWWPIVRGRIDQAIAAGYDGAYLDMIVTYEEIPANSAGTNRADLARKMVDLIAKTSQYAKSIDPDFKIVPQNAPELREWPDYLPAIDGLGMEEMYYKTTDRSCSQSWCAENRANAATIRAAGKLVLAVDYANQSAHIADAYTRARAADFVPYCTVVALDVMRVNPGWDP